MTSNVADLLRGGPDEIDAARRSITKNLRELSKSTELETQKKQFKYCLVVLRDLCEAANADRSESHERYCKIFVDVVAPYVNPEISPTHWTKYLEFIRYFHYVLITKSKYLLSIRVVHHLSSIPQQLYSENDYRHILDTYCGHILGQRRLPNNQGAIATGEVVKTFNAMLKLFNHMSELHQLEGFTYPDFLEHFLTSLVPKLSQNYLDFIATLPIEQLTLVLDSAFQLVMNLAPPLQEAMSGASGELFCKHSKLLPIVFHIDWKYSLKTAFTLKYLRVCRDLPQLWNEKPVKYAVSLLKIYFETLYAIGSDENFTAKYKDICYKFVAFLDRYGETIRNEKWWADIVILLHLVYQQIRDVTAENNANATTTWPRIQALMQTAPLRSHFELTAILVQYMPEQVDSKFLCTDFEGSGRNQILQSYMRNTIAYLHALMQRQNEDNKLIVRWNEMLEVVKSILKAGMLATGEQQTVGKDSYDLKILYARIAQLTRESKTSDQAKFSIAIAVHLVELKKYYSPNDWTLMLRRLYKTAEITYDVNLMIELQSCHIAATLVGCDEWNVSQLRNHIALFHSNLTPGMQRAEDNHKSLTELCKITKSVFRIDLTERQLYQLFWYEMDYFTIYQRKNICLQESLLSYCPHDYDFVLLARVGKLSTANERKLVKIVESLRYKRDTTGGLNRLEALMLGHSGATILLKQLEMAKNDLSFDMKLCQDEQLEELLKCPNLAKLTVVNEMKLINSALEVVYSFESFFNRFDEELLNEPHIIIDWDSLMDDMQAIAGYLQLTGYMDHAIRAWHLIHRLSTLLMDVLHRTRAAGFFAEYIRVLEPDLRIEIEHDLLAQTHTYMHIEKWIETVSRRQQTNLMLALCSLTYYFERLGNNGTYEMLNDLVTSMHQKVRGNGRVYDIITATLGAYTMRMHFNAIADSSQFPPTLFLRNLESVLGGLRDIYVASSDTQPYMVFLFNFIQELAEQSALRNYDSVVVKFLPPMLKMALQTCSSWRVLQILIVWMLTDLQMEQLEKAPIKLKLIECVLGTANMQELMLQRGTTKRMESKKTSLEDIDLPSIPNLHLKLKISPSISVVRKAVPVMYEEPFKLKRELSPYFKHNNSVNRFLTFEDCEHLKQYELYQWGALAAGCLQVRFFYLLDNAGVMCEFFKRCMAFFEQRQIKWLKRKFCNWYLLTQQFHCTYLRGLQKMQDAMKVVLDSLEICGRYKEYIDSVNRANVVMQLTSLLPILANESTTEMTVLRRLLSPNNITTQKTQIMQNLIRIYHGKMISGVFGTIKKSVLSQITFNADNSVRSRNARKQLPFDDPKSESIDLDNRTLSLMMNPGGTIDLTDSSDEWSTGSMKTNDAIDFSDLFEASGLVNSNLQSALKEVLEMRKLYSSNATPEEKELNDMQFMQITRDICSKAFREERQGVPKLDELAMATMATKQILSCVEGTQNNLVDAPPIEPEIVPKRRGRPPKKVADPLTATNENTKPVEKKASAAVPKVKPSPKNTNRRRRK